MDDDLLPKRSKYYSSFLTIFNFNRFKKINFALYFVTLKCHYIKRKAEREKTQTLQDRNSIKCNEYSQFAFIVHGELSV